MPDCVCADRAESAAGGVSADSAESAGESVRAGRVNADCADCADCVCSTVCVYEVHALELQAGSSGGSPTHKQ